MKEVAKSFGRLSKFVARPDVEREMLRLIERGSADRGGEEMTRRGGRGKETIVVDNPDLVFFLFLRRFSFLP